MSNGNTTQSSSVLDSPIFIGLAISLAAVPLYLALSSLKFEQDILTNFQNFIEWFGVPYALVLAAVLVNAWQQYETVERDFDREADAMSTLFQTSLLLEGKTNNKRAINSLKAQIKAEIMKYVKHIIGNYKDEPFSISAHKDGDDTLKNIRSLIGQAINLKQDLLARELLRILNDAQDIRGDRISDSKQRIKNSLWILSLVSSIVWLFPFYALHFKIPTFQSTFIDQLNYITSLILGPGLIFGVTFVVVAILFIIRDLNDPFSGSWSLDLDSWEELQKELA